MIINIFGHNSWTKRFLYIVTYKMKSLFPYSDKLNLFLIPEFASNDLKLLSLIV